MDNHHSHEYLSLLEAASANNITVLTFPHTTQYLCPLDRAVFGPFKREYDSVCSDYTSSSMNAIVNKVFFLKLLLNAAYLKSFTRVNIIAGFKSTGIFDWDPLVIPVKSFSASEPLDKLTQDNSTEEHPMKWVIRETESVGPEEELSAETEGMEHEDHPPSPVQEYSDEAIDTPAIPLPSNETDMSPLQFSPEIVDQDGNIVGQLRVEILSSQNDPVMPNIMSDEEVASVLIAMNE